MEDEPYRYTLDVFDFAPNLTIVGAFHSLNSEDKGILEELVAESDFVALECDEIRLKNHGGVVVNYSKKMQQGWNEEQEVFIFNRRMDLVFTRLLSAAIVYRNKIQNRTIAEDGSELRTTEMTEFEFCYELAKKSGKDIYLVDPGHLSMDKELALNLRERIQLLASIYVHTLDHIMPMPAHIPERIREPCLYKKIICDDREKFMLEEIERREGCKIPDLKRRGLLVVGWTHSNNYYESGGYLEQDN